MVVYVDKTVGTAGVIEIAHSLTLSCYRERRKRVNGYFLVFMGYE